MIRFEDVSKVYPDGTEAVSGLSLEVAAGETLVVLGTSGSGKTTAMKMVNRLIDPTGGRILIDQQDIMEQDPVALRRTIGYAIQHIGLLPHMTVGENIAIVPQLLKWPRAKIARQVDRLLSMTGLDPDAYRERYPVQLSGGQRQRVGVARALAADPVIVLMDEPFGALDPITRDKLQDEFLELEADIKKTILFVTHDIFEAIKMADRIALLNRGRLQQLATPADLVDHPANDFVRSFLGQHRLQLSLLTHTIQDVMQAEPHDETAPAVTGACLDPAHSLVQALDTFKNTRSDTLPVIDGSTPVGVLTKKRLIAHIAHILGDVRSEYSDSQEHQRTQA